MSEGIKTNSKWINFSAPPCGGDSSIESRPLKFKDWRWQPPSLDLWGFRHQVAQGWWGPGAHETLHEIHGIFGRENCRDVGVKFGEIDEQIPKWYPFHGVFTEDSLHNQPAHHHPIIDRKMLLKLRLSIVPWCTAQQVLAQGSLREL